MPPLGKREDFIVEGLNSKLNSADVVVPKIAQNLVVYTVRPCRYVKGRHLPLLNVFVCDFKVCGLHFYWNRCKASAVEGDFYLAGVKFFERRKVSIYGFSDFIRAYRFGSCGYLLLIAENTLAGAAEMWNEYWYYRMFFHTLCSPFNNKRAVKE